ncbi:MAG: phosphonate ABC transporter ATP-binding protein [Rhodospirillales bacterium]
MNEPGRIRITGLSKRFGATTILDRLTLEVAPGEVVALVGRSGAGKTTLFSCISRLTPIDEGEIVVSGRPLHALAGRRLARARNQIGVIFQQFNLVRRASARDNVLIGRLARTPTWRVLLRWFRPTDRQDALAALDRAGLLDHAGQRADRLSGGQRQRVAIARVLAQHCRVILADEPIASLDPETARHILSLLREVARERGITVICSLHQVEFARAFADRVVGLAQGGIIDGPIAPSSNGG